MNIQEVYQKAIAFAGTQHKNQLVPGSSSNYVVHLSNVAMEVLVAHKANPDFNLVYAVQVALLHDVLEDTDTSYECLQKTFGNAVASGVLALTKNEELISKSLQMRDSLQRIRQQCKEVSIVKLADRITNLQEPPPHWTEEKKQNYLHEAKEIATTLGEANEYLHQRILERMKVYQDFIG